MFEKCASVADLDSFFLFAVITKLTVVANRLLLTADLNQQPLACHYESWLISQLKSEQL
jgi:hypothetical protein